MIEKPYRPLPNGRPAVPADYVVYQNLSNDHFTVRKTTYDKAANRWKSTRLGEFESEADAAHFAWMHYRTGA